MSPLSKTNNIPSNYVLDLTEFNLVIARVYGYEDNILHNTTLYYDNKLINSTSLRYAPLFCFAIADVSVKLKFVSPLPFLFCTFSLTLVVDQNTRHEQRETEWE